jgi:probable F420-dependent oxidoreductase
MKFGLVFANTGPYVTGEGALTLARSAEAAGFDSLWTVEHVVVPEGYESDYPYDRSGKMPGRDNAPIPDPLIWLAYLASATTTIKLATGILILPQRNPLVLAKETATLDAMSGGRVILGVGAGWLEEEFDAIGVSFAERGALLDDHIGALRSLWTEASSNFAGPFTQFDRLLSYPKPAKGSIPVVIGGHSKAAARRAGRLGDGFFPVKGSLAEIRELVAIMRETALEAGRDPDQIELTVSGAPAFAEDPVSAIGEWAELGATRMVIPPLSYDSSQIGDALGAFGENVIAKVS